MDTGMWATRYNRGDMLDDGLRSETDGQRVVNPFTRPSLPYSLSPGTVRAIWNIHVEKFEAPKSVWAWTKPNEDNDNIYIKAVARHRPSRATAYTQTTVTKELIDDDAVSELGVVSSAIENELRKLSQEGPPEEVTQ